MKHSLQWQNSFLCTPVLAFDLLFNCYWALKWLFHGTIYYNLKVSLLNSNGKLRAHHFYVKLGYSFPHVALYIYLHLISVIQVHKTCSAAVLHSTLSSLPLTLNNLVPSANFLVSLLTLFPIQLMSVLNITGTRTTPQQISTIRIQHWLMLLF